MIGILINLFLLVRKRGCPHEYMDSWETFDEELLSDKEAFYSSLNMEGITDVHYRHVKGVYKEFNNKILGDYYDLCLHPDTLLLADVFENFRNMHDIYELGPADFLFAPGLTWQAALEKTGIKLELLTDTDTLFMNEKVTRGGICNVVHRCGKANNKYMKNYDKSKESSCLMYFDANNLYGWAMSQKLLVDDFRWKKIC